jgi:hypothetical protein
MPISRPSASWKYTIDRSKRTPVALGGPTIVNALPAI